MSILLVIALFPALEEVNIGVGQGRAGRGGVGPCGRRGSWKRDHGPERRGRTNDVVVLFFLQISLRCFCFLILSNNVACHVFCVL